MSLVWVINAPPPLKTAKVWRKYNASHAHETVVYYNAETGDQKSEGPYANRSHHVNVTSTQIGSMMTITFTLINIDKKDEGGYDLTVVLEMYVENAPRLAKLTVNGKS